MLIIVGVSIVQQLRRRLLRHDELETFQAA